MRNMRVALVLLAALPLGGCFSLVAEKPVPDWALSQARPNDGPETTVKRKVARHRTPHRTARNVSDAAPPTNSQQSRLSTGSTAPAGSGNASYSPEWQAHEKALDDRLREKMNICRGC
jgi:hypothetical protein